MKKTVRMTLYTLSILTIVMMVVLIVLANNQDHFSGSTSVLEVETESEGLQEEIDTESVVSTETEKENDEANVPEDIISETTLFFAGDVLINDRIAGHYDADGVTGLVSEELLKEMLDADITMINHEFQFSTQGTPMEDKQYTFEYDPGYVTILQDMGVDIVTLANNHALDFGKIALTDTMKTLDEAGILYVGAGESVERAQTVQVIEKNGLKFGFVGVTRVYPSANWNVEASQPGMFSAYDYTRLLQVIEAAKDECDFLTVYIHWGIERQDYPEDYQVEIATKCAKAGADLIIGSHPHVLQGIDIIEDMPVFYSLGNYVFSDNTNQTAGVKVVVQPDGTVSYQILPAYAQNSCTRLMNEENAKSLIQYVNDISYHAKVDEQGYVTYK